jgi:hypothetical protein
MAEELIETAQQQRTHRAKLNARKNPRHSDRAEESDNHDQDGRPKGDAIDLLA